MTDFQFLARGIALAGCGIGAGCALIAGIGPGIGEDPGRCTVGDHRYLRLRHRPAAHLPGSRYVHELPAVSAPYL